MSGQLFLSLCRDRHHRHRTRSTRFRRRTIRCMPIIVMIMRNDLDSCRINGKARADDAPPAPFILSHQSSEPAVWVCKRDGCRLSVESCFRAFLLRQYS